MPPRTRPPKSPQESAASEIPRASRSAVGRGSCRPFADGDKMLREHQGPESFLEDHFAEGADGLKHLGGLERTLVGKFPGAGEFRDRAGRTIEPRGSRKAEDHATAGLDQRHMVQDRGPGSLPIEMLNQPDAED